MHGVRDANEVIGMLAVPWREEEEEEEEEEERCGAGQLFVGDVVLE